MSLYTIIMEFRGGTYINQVKANTVSNALYHYAEELDTSTVKHFGDKAKKQLVAETLNKDNSPIPIIGVTNVYFFCASIKAGFVQINIIKTESR